MSQKEKAMCIRIFFCQQHQRLLSAMDVILILKALAPLRVPFGHVLFMFMSPPPFDALR